jgi:aryl-alcohol dehydrogenase-like predicted oxidoreductase
MKLAHRPLGNSRLSVSPVALGCWPIAGMTSLDVNERDSIATIEAAGGRNQLSRHGVLLRP